VHVDLRLPLGSLFAILGILLVGYGCFAAPSVFERSLGINIDLWWGVVMIVFGVFMVTMARRAARR
jgi:hypothetical protein